MPGIDWDSSQMREIEAEWKSLRDAYNKDPLRDFKQEWSGEQLFRTRLSLRQLRGLAASPNLPPLVDLKTGFENEFVSDLVGFMVMTFIRAGDRETLVDLLSKRCPRLIRLSPDIDYWGRLRSTDTIEYWLAFRAWKLSEPMLILGEAYARSQVPMTRRTLASSVRRSFAGLGIRGKDDAEFVGNAMRWYQQEKGHLIVNANYPLNEIGEVGISVSDSYERSPDVAVHRVG